MAAGAVRSKKIILLLFHCLMLLPLCVESLCLPMSLVIFFFVSVVSLRKKQLVALL